MQVGLNKHKSGAATAMYLLLGAVALAGRPALGADATTTAARTTAVILCPDGDCLFDYASNPRPTDGQGTTPDDLRYVVKSFDVRPNDKIKTRPGVQAKLCVQAAPGAKVNRVYGFVLTQADVGAPARSELVAFELPRTLGPGETGCFQGTVRSGSVRPVLAPLYPVITPAR